LNSIIRESKPRRNPELSERSKVENATLSPFISIKFNISLPLITMVQK
jgi:hypothetical protein